MWLIPGPIKRALSWLLGAIGFGLLAHSLGKREGRQRADTAALKDYQKTRKRIDEADIVGDDPDAARRWLHERSKQ